MRSQYVERPTRLSRRFGSCAASQQEKRAAGVVERSAYTTAPAERSPPRASLNHPCALQDNFAATFMMWQCVSPLTEPEGQRTLRPAIAHHRSQSLIRPYRVDRTTIPPEFKTAGKYGWR